MLNNLAFLQSRRRTSYTKHRTAFSPFLQSRTCRKEMKKLLLTADDFVVLQRRMNENEAILLQNAVRNGFFFNRNERHAPRLQVAHEFSAVVQSAAVVGENIDKTPVFGGQPMRVFFQLTVQAVEQIHFSNRHAAMQQNV